MMKVQWDLEFARNKVFFFLNLWLVSERVKLVGA